MGTKKVRYSSLSGLRIDNQFPVWTYPPLPDSTFLKQLNRTKQELAKQKSVNRFHAESRDHAASHARRLRRRERILERASKSSSRHGGQQNNNIQPPLRPKSPTMNNYQYEMMRKTVPGTVPNPGQR